MDKALLCNHCQRFSCICQRSTASETTSTNIDNPTKSSVVAAATDYDTTDNNNVLLRRSSTSQSNTSLNFGSNMFKRFAERMSSNSNFLSSLRTPTASSSDLLNEKT